MQKTRPLTIQPSIRSRMIVLINPPMLLPARIDRIAPVKYSIVPGTVCYALERGPNNTPLALWMD